MYPEFERLKKALLNFVKMSVNYHNYDTDFDDVSSYCCEASVAAVHNLKERKVGKFEISLWYLASLSADHNALR